jgi:hypothetical protein
MGMGWRDIRQGVSGLESVVGPPNQHEVQRAHVARSAQNNIVCLQYCVDSTFNIVLEPGPVPPQPALLRCSGSRGCSVQLQALVRGGVL